jgi:hemerythrin
MELTLKLNKTINEININNEFNNDSKRNKVIELFSEIIAFADKHFKHEETIMRDKNIDGYINHKAEHNKILKKMDDLKENYASGRLFLSSNLKTILLEWWINHTSTTDYRTFVLNYKPNK